MTLAQRLSSASLKLGNSRSSEDLRRSLDLGHEGQFEPLATAALKDLRAVDHIPEDLVARGLRRMPCAWPWRRERRGPRVSWASP